VILVGEVRDRDTAQMALSAAETGHLVFSTLHTRDAKGAITRLPDLFPPDVQSSVRSQLSMSLRAIVSQRLLPGVNKAEKRHLALEVMWNTHPIAGRDPDEQDREPGQLHPDRRDEGCGRSTSR
jgi:twitching motility protein PilT